MKDEENERLVLDSRMQYIDDFRKEFGSKIKLEQKEVPVIMHMYHNYIEDTFKQSELHSAILDKILEIEDEFLGSFNEEQKELFKKWEVYTEELSCYTCEQAFLYGYMLDKELTQERRNANEK